MSAASAVRARGLRGRDLVAAEAAAASFLECLGADLGDNAAQTPGRMARAFAELLTPRPFAPTTFTPATLGYVRAAGRIAGVLPRRPDPDGGRLPARDAESNRAAARRETT